MTEFGAYRRINPSNEMVAHWLCRSWRVWWRSCLVGRKLEYFKKVAPATQKPMANEDRESTANWSGHVRSHLTNLAYHGKRTNKCQFGGGLLNQDTLESKSQVAKASQERSPSLSRYIDFPFLCRAFSACPRCIPVGNTCEHVSSFIQFPKCPASTSSSSLHIHDTQLKQAFGLREQHQGFL